MRVEITYKHPYADWFKDDERVFEGPHMDMSVQVHGQMLFIQTGPGKVKFINCDLIETVEVDYNGS